MEPYIQIETTLKIDLVQCQCYIDTLQLYIIVALIKCCAL